MSLYISTIVNESSSTMLRGPEAIKTKQDQAGMHQKSVIQFFMMNMLRRLTTCRRRILSH